MDPRRRWLIRLGAIAALGFVARLVYALAVAPDLPARGDTLLYHYLANGIADGDGYVRPFSELMTGEPQPTASYPPLYPVYLAFFSVLGLDSLEAHRAVSCLLGTVAVVLIGLLGRKLGGERVGLVAAGLAAIYPQLVMVDGTVITEALYAPLIATILLLAYRLLEAPGPGRAAALGAAIGLAVLTRSESLLLVALLAVPACALAVKARPRWRAAAPLIAIALAATAVVLAPWTVRNAIVMDEPVVLTGNSGHTAAATVCDATFDGGSPYLGFVRHECALTGPCAGLDDELAQASCQRDEAWRYMREHLDRVPVVLAVRVLRVWELYRYQDDLGYGELWSRSIPVAKAGLVMYGLMVLLAIPGALALRRRRVALWPLLMLAVLVSIAAAMTFGFSRYRLAAEIPLTVLAGAGIDAAWRWATARSRGARPSPAPQGSA